MFLVVVVWWFVFGVCGKGGEGEGEGFSRIVLLALCTHTTAICIYVVNGVIHLSHEFLLSLRTEVAMYGRLDFE